MTMAVTWKGKVLKTYPEIIDVGLALEGEERKAFVRMVRDIGPHALSNVGYFAGYYDRETADRIYDAFETAHPIFGRTHPSPDEAFKLGTSMATEP